MKHTTDVNAIHVDLGACPKENFHIYFVSSERVFYKVFYYVSANKLSSYLQILNEM